MHNHGTQQVANKCSRLCAANQKDKEYWQKHGHYQDEAPVIGCFACKEQQRRAEERHQAEGARQRG